MGEFDAAVFGSVDDVLFFEDAELTRCDVSDEYFEQWLAGVSIREFELLLDNLLADHDMRWEPAPTFEQAE